MARFLPRLLGTSSTKNLTLRRAMTGPGYVYGFPAVSRWSVDRAIKDGFERTIWVYRGVDAIADNAARLPIIARQGNPIDGETIDDHWALRLLNRKSNLFEYAYEWRYRLSTQLLLSKRGSFVEKVPDRLDRVQEMYLLPPGRTAPIPDATRFVSAFRVTHSDEGWSDLPPDLVEWIRKPHPTDPYSGTTPLEAAGISIDIDFYARMYNRTFLMNDGRPGGIVAVKGDLLPEDAEELKRRFSGGPNRAGRTSVIEADDVSWMDTAVNPRDAQYLAQLKLSKDEILLALGVPESIIGNASSRTFANADAEEHIFWRNTMKPHMRLLEQGYDALFGTMDEDVYLVHDTRSISVLQRDEREYREELRKEFRSGVISANEYRFETGREEVDSPEARALWIAHKPALMPGDDVGDLASEKLKLEREPAAGQAGQREAGIQDDTKALPAPPGTKQFDKDRARADADARLSRWEAALEDVLVGAFDRQEQVILTRLNGPKARIGTRHDRNPDTAGNKSLDPTYIVDLDRWRKDLDADVEAFMGRLFGDTFAGYSSALGVDTPDLDAHPISDAIKGRAQRTVDAALRRAEKALQLIADGEEAGLDLPDLSIAVTDHYGKKDGWAKQLGGSEAAGAYNQASLMAVRWAAALRTAGSTATS